MSVTVPSTAAALVAPPAPARTAPACAAAGTPPTPGEARAKGPSEMTDPPWSVGSCCCCRCCGLRGAAAATADPELDVRLPPASGGRPPPPPLYDDGKDGGDEPMMEAAAAAPLPWRDAVCIRCECEGLGWLPTGKPSRCCVPWGAGAAPVAAPEEWWRWWWLLWLPGWPGALTPGDCVGGVDGVLPPYPAEQRRDTSKVQLLSSTLRHLEEQILIPCKKQHIKMLHLGTLLMRVAGLSRRHRASMT